MQIDEIVGVSPGPAVSPHTVGAGGRLDFSDMLQQSLANVNRLQLDAEGLIESAAVGDELRPEVVAMAVNKADLAVRTMIQIRNKLVQAFNELRQMQF